MNRELVCTQHILGKVKYNTGNTPSYRSCKVNAKSIQWLYTTEMVIQLPPSQLTHCLITLSRIFIGWMDWIEDHSNMNPTFPCELHSTVYRQRQSKKGQNKVRRLLTPKTLVCKITEHKILKIFKESSVTQLVKSLITQAKSGAIDFHMPHFPRGSPYFPTSDRNQVW